MDKTKKEVSVEVEFTDGYQERFTSAILKICEKRMQKGEPIIRREDASA